MKGEDLLSKTFRDALKKVSSEKNIAVADEILNYISQVLALYYRGLPLYLIDVVESTPFRVYKTKGDVALLLVGLFTEWINRTNRPLKEQDYINAGKLNYYNAYMYLNLNFGDVLQQEFEKLSPYQEPSQVLMGHMDIFRDISSNFEKYAYLLKEYREENRQISHLFDMFNELRQQYLQKFLEDF